MPISTRARGTPRSQQGVRSGGRDRWRRWYRGRRPVLWAFFGSRLAVLLAAFVARWIAPGDEAVQPAPWWAPVRILGTWDGQLYLSIAERGYPTEGSLDAFAFFPLWPLAVRAVEAMVPFLGPLSVGVLLAHVFTLAGALCLRSFVARETGSAETGDRAAIYVLVFPSAYVLSMVYAEALFLLLGVVFLDLLRRQRWGWAAAVGVLAGLTRPGGWLLALPAAVEGIRFVTERRRGGAVPKILGATVAGSGPVAGFVAYLGFVGWRTGDPLVPIGRQWQEGWKARPRFFLDSALDKADQIPELGATPDAFLGLAVLLGVGLAVYAFRVLPASMAVYAGAVVALGASTQVLIGTLRLLLWAIPLVWALALLGERRGFDRAWLPASAASMGVLAVAAFTSSWIP